MHNLTPPIPLACPTAPQEPDAFMQVGWLSSINSTLSGGTHPLETRICSKPFSLVSNYHEQLRRVTNATLLIIVSRIYFFGVQYEYV